MKFNKLKFLLAVSGIALLLAAFAAGWFTSFSWRAAYAGSFSRRLANSVDFCMDDSNERLPYRFWRNERSLHLLRTAVAAIKTNGVISSAYISSPSESGHIGFDLVYLSKDADVRDVVFMNGEEPVYSMLTPYREWNKLAANDRVLFFDGGIWGDSEHPYPLPGHRVEDLSVKVVKNDGSVIGPVRVLSSNDVWEEIRSKMLTEKKWQDKFPWLHARLLEDPSMPPMWENPETLPPARENEASKGAANKIQ